jgi:hypothetical protein
MKVDPAWAHRRLLLRSGNELSPKALARLKTVFATDDPTNEISAAWGVKGLLAQMLGAHGPNGYSRHETSTRRTRFLAACVDADMPEAIRLAGPIEKWWPEIEGFLELGQTMPGPRAATVSSSRSNASPAGSVISTTMKGASCCTAQPAGLRELAAVEVNPAQVPRVLLSVSCKCSSVEHQSRNRIGLVKCCNDGNGGLSIVSDGGLVMTSVPVNDMAPGGLDTVRALLHDLRQPLAAIVLLAGAESGDLRGRLDKILDQARWLSDLVEGVIGGAADDRPERVDVVELAQRRVRLAQNTAGPEIEYLGLDRFLAVTAPVALSRALSCVLDNAVRAAGPGGHVTVAVTGIDNEVTIRVIDDGPGLGQMPSHNSLGLTITRALVSACGGDFDLRNGAMGGVVAQIVLPRIVLPGPQSERELS